MIYNKFIIEYMTGPQESKNIIHVLSFHKWYGIYIFTKIIVGNNLDVHP